MYTLRFFAFYIALCFLFPFVANAQSRFTPAEPIVDWDEYYEKIYDAVCNQDSREVILWTKRFLNTSFESVKTCRDEAEDLTDPEWLLNQVLVWNAGHVTVWAAEARTMLAKAQAYRPKIYPNCKNYRGGMPSVKAIDFKHGSFQLSNLHTRTLLIHYTDDESAILILKPIKKSKSNARVVIVDRENKQRIRECNKVAAQCRLEWIPNCGKNVCEFEISLINDSDMIEWIRVEANY